MAKRAESISNTCFCVITTKLLRLSLMKCFFLAVLLAHHYVNGLIRRTLLWAIYSLNCDAS